MIQHAPYKTLPMDKPEALALMRLLAMAIIRDTLTGGKDLALYKRMLEFLREQ